MRWLVVRVGGIAELLAARGVDTHDTGGAIIQVCVGTWCVCVCVSECVCERVSVGQMFAFV